MIARIYFTSLKPRSADEKDIETFLLTCFAFLQALIMQKHGRPWCSLGKTQKSRTSDTVQYTLASTLIRTYNMNLLFIYLKKSRNTLK